VPNLFGNLLKRCLVSREHGTLQTHWPLWSTVRLSITWQPAIKSVPLIRNLGIHWEVLWVWALGTCTTTQPSNTDGINSDHKVNMLTNRQRLTTLHYKLHVWDKTSYFCQSIAWLPKTTILVDHQYVQFYPCMYVNSI
jgi:hypothetical protein